MFGLPLGWFIGLILLAIFFLNWIKVLNEYERGVIFRFGKLLPYPKGPGLIFVFSPIDRMVKMSLRLVALDVPPQDVITRDNVSVKVNAVVFFRVVHPIKAVVEVENFLHATSQLAQTMLRSVLGQVELDDLLSERERLNMQLQAPWTTLSESRVRLAAVITTLILGITTYCCARHRSRWASPFTARSCSWSPGMISRVSCSVSGGSLAAKTMDRSLYPCPRIGVIATPGSDTSRRSLKVTRN